MTLEEFARVIMSIKPVLNNPDAFNKWMKNEEVKFEESLSYYVGLITVYVTLYYFPPPGKAIFLLYICIVIRIFVLLPNSSSFYITKNALIGIDWIRSQPNSVEMSYEPIPTSTNPHSKIIIWNPNLIFCNELLFSKWCHFIRNL